MDGNNRFSKKKNISQFDSYKLGAKKLLEITEFIFDSYETNLISTFALSVNNTKRSKKLISTLMRVLEYFVNQNNNVSNYKFQINFKGDLNFLPKNLLKKITQLEKKNPQTKKKLLIYLNYSGQLDILNTHTKKLKKLNIFEFKKLLITKDFPDPDILIRTGGYQRISDFFLFQISFTELFFLKKLWPELQKSDIKNIINKYINIERKFGC